MVRSMEGLTEWTLFDAIDETPILPYGGTSGWSGTPTSQQRATRNDSDGTTSRRQRDTIRLLASNREHGATWRDVSRALELHHGSASGVLSVLHKTGVIERLSEQRDGCLVYVLPEHVNGRTTSAYRPNVSARLLTEILQEIEHDLSNGDVYVARQRIRRTLETFNGHDS